MHRCVYSTRAQVGSMSRARFPSSTTPHLPVRAAYGNHTYEGLGREGRANLPPSWPPHIHVCEVLIMAHTAGPTAYEICLDHMGRDALHSEV